MLNVESFPRLLQIQVFVWNLCAQRIVPELFIEQGHPTSPLSTRPVGFAFFRLEVHIRGLVFFCSVELGIVGARIPIWGF